MSEAASEALIRIKAPNRKSRGIGVSEEFYVSK